VQLEASLLPECIELIQLAASGVGIEVRHLGLYVFEVPEHWQATL
jgi:hypothetical protein